jgi:hypothetical protein
MMLLRTVIVATANGSQQPDQATEKPSAKMGEAGTRPVRHVCAPNEDASAISTDRHHGPGQTIGARAPSAPLGTFVAASD